MGNNLEWPSAFQNIKSTHDFAYKVIEEAISLEEDLKPVEALEKYKEAISIIDKALSIQVVSSDNPDETWREACRMISKLKRSRAEVLYCINSLKSLNIDKIPTAATERSSKDIIPTVPAERRLSKDIAPKTYSDLAKALKNLELSTPSGMSTVIYEHENVKMYYISPDGDVLSTSESQALTFFSIEGDVPNVFLQVGNWIYPLIPGVSPCYRTSYNYFIFPDVHSEIEGSSVGIVVPDEGDEIVYELLINILHGVIVQHEPEDESTVGEKISYGIVKGAGYLAQGLVTGAKAIGNLLNYGTPKLINNMTPASENTTISPTVSNCLKMTETATQKTAEVTGYVADKVVLATSKLGQYLAPHIQKQGTRLLQSSMQYSEEEASSKVKNVLGVAAGAVEGFSTIYHGLETSASILGSSLKDNTVKIVQHKYGSPAGDVATDTLNTVGHVYSISRNTRILTPTGLVKCTVKDAGKAVVKDYRYEPRDQQVQGALKAARTSSD